MSLLARAILIGLLTAAALPAEPAAQAPKRILILYDENKDDFPGLASIDRTLRKAFQSEVGKAVEIYTETLALSQFERAGYDAAVADFYRRKYAGTTPDLIVAVMEPSLDFLLRHGDSLFPGVPIVFCGVDASTIAGKRLRPNVTGVLLKRTFSPTLDVVLQVQPETRNVFVVGGVATFDRYLETFVRRDLQPFERRVDITYLFGLSMDAWLKRLSTLPPHSVILYTSVFTDGAGHPFVPHEAVAAIAAAANAPVYVFMDQYVGLGPVGGNVYSLDMHGAHVAALGLQVLRGAPPASLPIRELGAQENLFDARQLKRWHLDEARLPSGSVVRYQDFSVWAQYRWYILGALAVLVTQGALIGGLLLARARQQRAEADARVQRDDLAHVLRVTAVGELTTSLAHEISQPVSAILLNARAARRLMDGGQPGEEVAGALADIAADAHHVSRVIDRLRALFRREHAQHVAVDMKALIEDAVRLLHSAMLIERVDIHLVADPVPAVSGDPVQLEQVLLNVLMNACEAIGSSSNGTRTITIGTRELPPRHVTVEVTDTGVGVKDADLERIFGHFVSTKPKGLGMGLAISRSIIKAHGGRIWASANTGGGGGGGLTMHIELPCSPRATRETPPSAPAIDDSH
jgi:signal transduction histidine kinase